MGQLTLNLIAISVFLVTFATLLGPLLQIPQAVPAIAVVTVLAIAIIDQAQWNGTVGNLLLGGLNRFSAAQRQRVLHHEAGHLLVAHLLSIPVTDYSLTAWDAWRKGFPGQGGVQFDTATLEAAMGTGQIPAQLLNRYCMVWMAGVAAEQLMYGDALGGQDDRQKFTILWQQLGRTVQQGLAQQRWALLQAKTLLEQHREAYQTLVEAMAEQSPVGDCQALLTEKGAKPTDQPS
ncbi:MAG: ATP-dependent Zn protease [Cyanobacteria bacterium]|nr:ATP-dependent Zn protease [Cyanobacteriota bacterium]MDA0865794.1 ATP-dependent Zn protease [Cyanobacteriota bacterium]